LKEQVYKIVYLLAVIAYFIPALIVLFKKLYKDRIVVLFATYWAIGGFINVSDHIPGISKELSSVMAVVYNLLDFPLVLFIFYYSTNSARLKKFIRLAGPAYILLAIVNCAIKGFSYDALIYVVGVGTVLVLVVVGWEVLRYFRKMEHTHREKAMIFIYAAMLFEYGSYVIVYIFDFFLVPEQATYDNLLVYYASTLIGVAIASIGFLSKDLRQARHENWDRALTS
jgi:hypothetical protein